MLNIMVARTELTEGMSPGWRDRDRPVRRWTQDNENTLDMTFYVSANEKVFGGNGEVVFDTNNVNTLDSLSN